MLPRGELVSREYLLRELLHLRGGVHGVQVRVVEECVPNQFGPTNCDTVRLRSFASYYNAIDGHQVQEEVELAQLPCYLFAQDCVHVGFCDDLVSPNCVDVLEFGSAQVHLVLDVREYLHVFIGVGVRSIRQVRSPTVAGELFPRSRALHEG